MSPVPAEPILQDPPGGALAGDRPRVIVSTDVGGSDPDDFQSLVFYLVHSDLVDTEGLIASPPGAGRAQHILDTLAAYEQDYDRLRSHSPGFPSPDALRAVTKQGAINAAPAAGFSSATAGSNWIIQQARQSDSRPLYILVWGSITDLAQAVHDDPGIKPAIRVYSIGSWNTQQDPHARNYLYGNHADLWWIEADTTFRGMYVGGDQSGDLGNLSFVQQHVKGHGALGDFFWAKKQSIKAGDTPSLMYLLRGDPNDPASDHWGGRFKPDAHGPQYWVDLTDPLYRDGGYNGAKTVNQWRENYLREWQRRMDWAAAPASPLIVLSKHDIEGTVDPGDDLPDDTFTVANGGIGTLRYSVRADQSWLTPEPAGGLSAGEADEITISYAVAALTIGTHVGVITVADDGSVPAAINSPQTVMITVRVKTVLPDLDKDGDVDQTDFGRFQVCLGQEAPTLPLECQAMDMSGDTLVNKHDLDILLACLSGPNVMATKTCDDAFE